MAKIQGITLFATLLSPLLSCLAAPLADSAANNGIVRLPLKRHVVADVETNSRRDLPVSLTNYKVGYLADLSIGSPPQNVKLVLDTGSSEIWTLTPNTCNKCKGGTYSPSLSTTDTTASDLGPFSIAYGDQSSASGYYVADNVHLGSASISNVFLGVATKTYKFENGYGVMGIGFDSAHSNKQPYAGLVEKMYSQKVISSKSYSIYLDDVEASTGSIDFGGIDSTKYTGKLVSLPIIPRVAGDNINRLQVEWTSLSITNATGVTAQLTAPALSYPVLLDTGATLTAVPPTIFYQLAAFFGAKGPDNGAYYVNCNMPKGYLTFGFGAGPAVTIRVPFSELAIQISPGTCWFGLRPLDGPVMALGDTFLRSAYVNFDFGRNRIGLAQSAWK